MTAPPPNINPADLPPAWANDLIDTVARLTTQVERLSASERTLADAVAIARAETSNALTRISNRFQLPLSALRPLQKVTPGSGLERALAVAGVEGTAPDHPLQLFAQANPTPAIGSTPPLPAVANGVFNILALSNDDILQMICFYNDDMGVVPAHSLEDRLEVVLSYFRL